jgi:hypothetical protein
MLMTLASDPKALGGRSPLASGDSLGPDAEDDAADELVSDDPDAVLPEPPLPAQPATRLAVARPASRPPKRRRDGRSLAVLM